MATMESASVGQARLVCTTILSNPQFGAYHGSTSVCVVNVIAHVAGMQRPTVLLFCCDLWHCH